MTWRSAKRPSSPAAAPAVAVAAATVARAAGDEIDALGPWFHNLHLPDGRQTFSRHWAGDFPNWKWQQLAPHLPQDLRGWRCLDIGCNAGFYTFELARRGAEVLGIDVDDHYLSQARWACAKFGLTSRVRFERMQVYDLARRAQRFDLVLFMGVLYHLRYPMLGLDIVCQKVNRLLVFQTLTMSGQDAFAQTWGRNFEDRELFHERGWPKMAFLEHHFAGDPTNWWVPNDAGVQAMLRSAGMKVTSRPGHEIYLAEPDRDHPSCVSTWNSAELRSATGQPNLEVHMAKSKSSSSSSGSSSRGRGRSRGGAAQATTDHEQIRKWAQERGGKPACVKGTRRGESCLLRIDFPGGAGEESLEEIPWDEFFNVMDERGLVFLYQPGKSTFNKIVSPESVEGKEQKGRSSGGRRSSGGGSGSAAGRHGRGSR
jgi:tRNA (mo5U34)-methyltransferase